MKSLLLFTALFSYVVLAVISDHEDIALLDTFSQSTMDAVGQQRWLFTHASVGLDMINGMNDLHNADATRYKLTTEEIGYTGSQETQRADDAPATTTAGTIYECPRGNPGWANKLHCFSNSVTISGWNKENDKVDFAMDKFCYIDPTADTNVYIETMNNLAAVYSMTKIVWMTIPIKTSDGGSEQDARNEFNKFIRKYCAENDINLLDIADIEAHDTNGVEQFYVSGSITNQKMWASYSTDGGHLNTLGRQRVAKGWYALAAQNVIPEPCGILVLFLMPVFALNKMRELSDTIWMNE